MKKLLLLITVILIIAANSFAQDKYGAKVFYNFKYDENGSPTNEFEIRRAYLTYQNQISDDMSYKFTSDVGRYGGDDRLSLYVKNALVKWKTSYGDLVFGMQGMNVFKIQEYNWGYRFIEKSAMDLRKFSSSADLGFGYYNKFSSKLNFSTLVTNGTGYKKSENDDYKKYSFQLFYGDSKISKDGNFNIGAVASLESFDFEVDSVTTNTESKTVFSGFAAYKTSGIKVGAEYNMFKTGGANITRNVLSAYANYSVNKQFDVFARIDIYDPNADEDEDGNTYIIAGINFKPAKMLYIAPTIKYSKPEIGDAMTIYQINFQFKV